MNFVFEAVKVITKILFEPFGKFIFDSIGRKKRTLLVLKESESLIPYLSKSFIQDFVVPDLEEKYFYIQSEISTNYQSIKHYIGLKNKIGGNFTWKEIKSALPYLKIEDNGIIVNLSKKDKNRLNAIFIFVFLLYLSPITFAFFVRNIKFDSWNRLLFLFTLYIFPFLLGLFILYRTTPLATAFQIKNKLEKINQTNEQVNENTL